MENSEYIQMVLQRLEIFSFVLEIILVGMLLIDILSIKEAFKTRDRESYIIFGLFTLNTIILIFNPTS